MLYFICFPYATFAVITNHEDIVVDAPPIAHWTIGMSIETVEKYYIGKGATINAFNRDAYGQG